jgi:predicted ester cyclase
MENFRKIFAATPDHSMHVEDRIIAGDKVVARTTHTATHTDVSGHTADRKAFHVQDYRYLAG